MTSEDAVRKLAEALLASPTVRLGDDVEPAPWDVRSPQTSPSSGTG